MAHQVRSLLIRILALWNRLQQKEIGKAARLTDKKVSEMLRLGLSDRQYERLLGPVTRLPGQVPVVQACLDGLEALDRPSELTDEVRASIEAVVCEAARLTREGLTEALLRARPIVPAGYPEPAQRLPARRWAAALWEQVKHLAEEDLIAVIRYAERLQTWAMCELLCEASVREASRDLERAATLARAAQAVAELVRGLAGWLRRLKGYAAAHWANVLRVQGDLEAADAELDQAKRLWQAGSDPDGVLDPGRLLHFEAALRRDQCRFTEALERVEEAAVLSYPERALVSKGVILEAMGDYERAIETLLEAQLLVDQRGEPRDCYIVRFNRAVCLTHLGAFREAEELLIGVRALAAELNDAINLDRTVWLAGRIAGGLGKPSEALKALKEARRGFAMRGMSYDVALALLEEAALLLDEGRTAEVKALTPELAKVFDTKGVHREALAALRLFQVAVEREEATAELARRVLRYLFRARHDQDLRFIAS